MKAFIAKAILLLITIVVCLLTIEMVLRLRHPKQLGNELVTFEYRHPWVVNSDGFRDREISARIKKDGHNIIVTGDSFAAGMGVERELRFSSLLQEELKGEYEVFNLAVPGSGTLRQLHALEKHIQSIRPRYVLHFFFWNDLYDNVTNSLAPSIAQSNDQARDSLKKEKNFLAILKPIKPYLQDSLLYQKTAMTIKDVMWRIGWKAKLQNLLEVDLFKVNSQSPEVLQAWKNTKQWLARMRELSEEHGAQFILIYIPKKHQIIQWESVLHFYGLLGENYDRFLSNKRLGEVARELSIDYIDVSSDLDRASDKRALYYKADSHFTALGHSVFFQLLRARISHLF